MAIIQNFDGTLGQADLQTQIGAAEAGAGPVDGLSTAVLAGASVTAVVFDTSILLAGPVSTLVTTGMPSPPGNIPYVRGQCLIHSASVDEIAFVPKDENTLAARAVSFLQSFGWTRPQAIGITANIRYEGNFDPAALGDSGTAYGLCQWRGSRQTDFATSSQGLPLVGSTFREQLQFILWELNNTYHVAGGLLRATTNPTDAATVVCVNYEVPKNPAIDTPIRVAYALHLDAIL
jgi:hypothetical protein